MLISNLRIEAIVAGGDAPHWYARQPAKRHRGKSFVHQTAFKADRHPT